MKFLREFRDSYYAVKRNHRMLKVAYSIHGASKSDTKYIDEFIRSIRELQSAQLKLEELYNDLAVYPKAFKRREDIGARIRQMEKSLRGKLSVFENNLNGPKVTDDPGNILAELVGREKEFSIRYWHVINLIIHEETEAASKVDEKAKIKPILDDEQLAP